MRNREGKSDIEKSEQRIQNWSFDEEFKVSATEGLSYDGTNLKRDIHADLKLVLYEDSNYHYICESAPGTALTTAKWRVTRILKTTSNVDYADLGSFLNPATDLETVQGLSFS